MHHYKKHVIAGRINILKILVWIINQQTYYIMEKAIKILTAVGAIIGGIGELLRQFNLASENVKSTIAEQAKDTIVGK